MLRGHENYNSYYMVLLINIKTSSFYFEQKAFLASKNSIRKSAEKTDCFLSMQWNVRKQKQKQKQNHKIEWSLFIWFDVFATESFSLENYLHFDDQF